jgi:putative glutamine amidotransferase
MSKPKIGVSGPERGGWVSWFYCRLAIYRAGGKAVRITPNRPVDINQLDGLILGGGVDIHPNKYHQEIMKVIQKETKKALNINLSFFITILTWIVRQLFSVSEQEELTHDTKRDALEFDLLSKALARQIPVLGICRGAQLINIFFEGTLHQDILKFYVETPYIYTSRARKWIDLDPNSCLAKSMKKSRIRVNSLHHQSIDKLGKELKVVAWEENGIVQAIEHQSLPFVVGVQWHPEYLPRLRSQKNIFKSLIRFAQKQ